MKRVVVTGMGGITALGQRWAQIEQRLRARQSAVRQIQEFDKYVDMHTRLGAPVLDFQVPEHYPRRTVRSMGRVALLSVRASELALEDAGLLNDPIIRDGRMGIAYGSSFGSAEPLPAFGRMIETGKMQGVTSTTYIQIMSHTGAVNIGLYFGLRGRLIPTSTACTSGSQAIGYAYEAIKFGRQQLMVAGGSEEFGVAGVAVFDSLFATSTRNDKPELTPRPFDRARDGLVVGEGAGTLILEELEHAKARGAKIYAEVVGFGCNSDGAHVTQPEAATMAVAMELALKDAGLPASAIGYVNAHGTATDRGDIAESRATHQVFGSRIPISSLKSYIGHTLGACGSIEAWLTIEMMRNGWYSPTINLDDIDPACAELQYIRGDGAVMQNEHVMSNNFAFGGINTSLVFKRL
ncbi:MAG: beta-ketoacyl-ACP synthase [Gammaproteobacteria bacterium]|nr:beta-ketoacyl-ACP synthase [Gammaproteobacteria bacterium]